MRPRYRHSSSTQQTPTNNDDDDEYSTTNKPSSSSSVHQSNTFTNTTKYNQEEADIDDKNDNDNEELTSSYDNNTCASNNYVPIAPLPIFHGLPSECPLSHLSRFRHVCIANGAPNPPSTIFPVTLDSHAALWYDLAIDPHPDLSWHDVQSHFLNFFLRPEHADVARSDLLSIKQADNESSAFYYLRMQWILRKWPGHGLPDSMLMGVFVDGLREEFREWVVPQRPETLEEAVRLAENWERVRGSSALLRRREIERVVVIKCGFCEGVGHEERECEVRRRMRELWLRTGNGDDGGLGRVVSLGRKKGFERSRSCLTDKNQGNIATESNGGGGE